MAEQGLYLLRVEAGQRAMHADATPQIVWSYMIDAGALHDGLPPALRIGHRTRRMLRRSKDKDAACILPETATQNLDGGLTQPHGDWRSVLRLFAADKPDAGIKIDVRPAQAKQICLPHPGEQPEDEVVLDP